MKAEIFNAQYWISECDKEKLTKFFHHALKEAEFTVCNYVEKDFKPYGFTGLWLLAESHFAVHTFPEAERTYIEISSCNMEKHQSFQRHIYNAHKAKIFEVLK